MTTTAIGFLVLSLVVVWGGLAASIVRLRRDGQGADDDGAPDEPDLLDDPHHLGGSGVS